MNIEWKKIKEEKYNAGWRKMLRKTFVLPDGSESDYDIKDEKTAVHMFVLTEDNKVILERMFSPGSEKVVLDMPAGFVSENELPIDAAKRELLEELGMEGEIELAGKSLDDHYANTVRHVYVVKNFKKVADVNLEKGEIFEIVELTIDEFRKHLMSGLITHAEAGYIALDYLGML